MTGTMKYGLGIFVRRQVYLRDGGNGGHGSGGGDGGGGGDGCST